MFEKVNFQLIVPISYDRNDFQKILSIKEMKSVSQKDLEQTDKLVERNTDIWFRHCFFRNSFSTTSQMENSPVLKDTFCERFELAQIHRNSVGIHKNENCKYRFKREEIYFEIRKVMLIFTKLGIAFICMNIHSEQLDENQVLNLNVLLRDIKRNPKLLYGMQVAKNEYIEKNVGLKDIIKNIVQLQSYIRLYEYKGETFSDTYRLLYLTGCINKEKVPSFFEICRNSQKSTEFPEADIARNNFEKYCLKVRAYLYFAVGIKTVVGYGDLEEAGVENRFFLTDKGGLQKSVSENYLLMYLYMLSILLCVKNLELETSVKDLNLVKEITNLKRNNLSNVVHINKLFEEYLAEKTEGWHLEERVTNIRKEYLREDNGSDIGNQVKNAVDVIAEIGKQNTNIIESLNQINTKMDTLLGFVQNDLSEYLAMERKWLNSSDTRKEDETQIGVFNNRAAEYIGKHMDASSDIVAKERNYLVDLFGERNWEKLLPDVKISLISAATLWKTCKDIKAELFDYSGVCITATAALESELKEIFFTGFIQYMVKTYGQPDVYNLDKTYNSWPEYLLSISKDKAKSNSYNRNIKVIDVFTMGKLPYLFGKYDYTNKSGEKHVHLQAELMKRRMQEYLKTIIVSEYKETPLQAFTKPKGNTFVDKCESIRADYRNKAAHSDIIVRKDAEQCYNRIIGKSDAYQYKEDVIGVLLELLEKIK